MYQPISKIVCVLALCCTTPLYANDATDCKEVKFQATDQAWTGHYYLQGVMEVGSELLLQDHGKFKWYLAVGSFRPICRRHMVEKWQLYWLKSIAEIHQTVRNFSYSFKHFRCSFNGHLDGWQPSRTLYSCHARKYKSLKP